MDVRCQHCGHARGSHDTRYIGGVPLRGCKVAHCACPGWVPQVISPGVRVYAEALYGRPVRRE